MVYLRAVEQAEPRDQADELRAIVARILQMFKLEDALAPDNPYARMRLPDLNVVLFLGESTEPVTMGTIATFLDARLSSAGSIVERLFRARLARRERVEHDRRVVLVSLTPEGAALWQEIVTVQTGHCQAMLDALDSDSERAQLLAILSKIARGATSAWERRR